VGIKAESIHGNKNHGQRQRALQGFKDGRVRVLVATDVAARGIHVDDVSHVINYDLPNTFEDYLHRIGRTGRGSKRGKALTFVPDAHAQEVREHRAHPRGETDSVRTERRPYAGSRPYTPRTHVRGGEGRGNRSGQDDRGSRGPRRPKLEKLRF
jgi:ATP-dependent RNA helicase RhlE